MPGPRGRDTPAALLLFHAEVSGAPLVTRSGQLVGVISERDVMDVDADDLTWVANDLVPPLPYV